MIHLIFFFFIQQYCLEEGVNLLNDEDFVIHLDEETVLTEDAVRGILNFVSDNKHAIGQGRFYKFWLAHGSIFCLKRFISTDINTIMFYRLNHLWNSTTTCLFKLQNYSSKSTVYRCRFYEGG